MMPHLGICLITKIAVIMFCSAIDKYLFDQFAQMTITHHQYLFQNGITFALYWSINFWFLK